MPRGARIPRIRRRGVHEIGLHDSHGRQLSDTFATVTGHVFDSRAESTLERWARRVCGALAVGGGASGLIVSLAGGEGLSSPLAFVIWVVFELLYAAGVWVGLRLIENDPGAWKWLKIYLWLQVPVLQTAAITFDFGSLMSFSWVYAGAGTFRFVYTPTSGWAFSLFTAQPALGLGVNVLPACVLLALWALKIRR